MFVNLNMSKKLGKYIAKGSLDLRLKERNITRPIKKIQKSEKKLLLEIKSLIDSGVNNEEIKPVCKNIIDSRMSIQKLKRLQYYVKAIQSYYRKAQLLLLSGETIVEMEKSIQKVNKIMTTESMDETFIAMENESGELNLNLEQVTALLDDLDFVDPLQDEDSYVNKIIQTLEQTEPKNIEITINEIVATDNLLPEIPKEIFEVEPNSLNS